MISLRISEWTGIEDVIIRLGHGLLLEFKYVDSSKRIIEEMTICDKTGEFKTYHNIHLGTLPGELILTRKTWKILYDILEPYEDTVKIFRGRPGRELYLENSDSVVLKTKFKSIDAGKMDILDTPGYGLYTGGKEKLLRMNGFKDPKSYLTKRILYLDCMDIIPLCMTFSDVETNYTFLI